MEQIVDKLQLKELKLDRVFNTRSDCMHAMHLLWGIAKLPNLELKT
jgi:hypothetical protein